jgi:hypothetical protein
MSRFEFRKVKIVGDEQRPCSVPAAPQRPSKRRNYRKRNEALPPLPSQQPAGASNVAA